MPEKKIDQKWLFLNSLKKKNPIFSSSPKYVDIKCISNKRAQQLQFIGVFRFEKFQKLSEL